MLANGEVAGEGKDLLNPIGGLAVSGTLGLAAFFLGDQPWLKDNLHVSPLLLSILLGMALASVLRVPESLLPGIQFAQRPLLRWGVAGLGFRLSLSELAKIGGPGLIVVVISTAASLFFGWWLARRAGLDEKLGILLGVGTSICGASAIVAADSVVQGEKKDSAYSMGIITLLGTLGIVLYPLIYHISGMNERIYSLWNGASLHEMAQVVAAGDIVSQAAADDSTVVKLARICLLAPVVFGLAWWLKSHHRKAGTAHIAPVPWFLIVFLLFVVVNSSGWPASSTTKLIQQVDLAVLCVGMVGVGLGTGFKDLRAAGLKPVLVGGGQWLFLSLVSLGLATSVAR